MASELELRGSSTPTASADARGGSTSPGTSHPSTPRTHTSATAARRTSRWRLAALALCASSALGPGGTVAHAGGRGGVDLERFRWQPDDRGLFSTQSADALFPEQWTFGLAMPYSHEPFVVARKVTSAGGSARALKTEVVAGRLTGNFGGALGILPWLSVGAVVPVVFYNPANPKLGPDTAQITGFGASDLEVKFTLLRQPRHGLGLSLIAGIGLPTGNHNAFLGQDFMTFSPQVVVQRKLGKRVRLLGNLGVTARKAATYGNLSVESDLFWNAGVGVRVHDRIELASELYGSTPLTAPFTSDDRLNPLELLAGARVQTSDNTTLSVAAGPGLSRGYGTPQFRAFLALTYSNAQLPDRDRDGTPDKYDRCPDEPGPRSNRGCPVEIVDLPELNLSPVPMPHAALDEELPQTEPPLDPLAPERLPDLTLPPPPKVEPKVEEQAPEGEPPYLKAIRTLRIVNFEFDKARIQGKFQAELELVAKALNENPEIELVEIGGHTDDIGTRKANLGLSRRRAAAIRDFLISRGVAPGRLLIRGYAFDRPLVRITEKMSAAEKADAREKNRRAQFEIIKETKRSPAAK